MSNDKLTETVTVTRPVSQRIADLVYFARYLEKYGYVTIKSEVENKDLIEAANEFWDMQHGED